MLKKFNIRTLLALSFSVVLLLLILVNIQVVLTTVSSVVKEAEQRELRGLYESAKAELESEGRLANALATLVANMDMFSAMFANGERDPLAENLVPVFKVLKQDFSARQFQYHTPPAISFLRLHKPEKFGDDLSSFRKTVVATNESRKSVVGLEKGVAGLGIRGISPVFHQGEHIGSVEFCMSFVQPFFEHFKEKYHVDLSLYVNSDGGFKKFGSTLAGESLLSPAEMTRALDRPVISQQVYKGLPLAVYAYRVEDYNGNPVGVLELGMDRSHYAAAISQARNTAIFIGVIALLVGLIMASFIARMIGGPLIQTVDAMNEIAEGGGDLTRRLDESGDNEISRLARAFNHFAEKVRVMVSQVYGSTTQLASAAEEMSAITEETNRGTQQQQSETSQVVTAMNQMTATVQEVARHATDAASAANKADQASIEGKQVVIATMQAIENLSSEVHAAASVISQLEKDSENIGAVLDVIKGIAEQTNLLALNAAIEAARAGEQGRGFAVVADEVRNLASKTQQSTQEIHDMIARLQAGAQSAVKVMAESRTRAEDSVSQAARAGTSLEAITSAVSLIKDMNTQIATAAEEQSAVAEEINRNVVNISDIVDRTAEGASQTSVASEQLARLAGELQQLVNQFKV
jgi:methyl-accepting chemotaxis protein